MNNTQSGRIIIVDDEIDVMTLLRDFLSGLEYEVEGYVSVQEALEALKGKDFDLVLTDLVMPEMDGITFMKSAQEIDPRLVCIVITGHATVQNAVEAMKVGAFDYITKPVDWKSLRPVLSRAMEVSRLKKSEEKYRSIVEDRTELICRFLPDGTLTFVNEPYCRYFSKTEEDLIGKSFFPFLPDEDKEFVKKQYFSLSPDNPTITSEHRVIKPDGGIGWQQWTNRALFDNRGHLIEFQAVGHDVTERVHAEEALKNSRDQLKALTKRLAEAEEAERQRHARELHDQVGQNLTALGINLNMIRAQLSPIMTEEIDLRINDSMKILEETAKSIRDVMTDLRPSVLDDYGLMAAMRWYGDQFSKRANINIVVQGADLVPRLPLAAEMTFFRIAQEVLTNVAKHAMARNVTIVLEEEGGTVRLTIKDDGIGFDPEIFRKAGGKECWGLINIQERAETIGGTITIESESGKGAKVVIEMER